MVSGAPLGLSSFVYYVMLLPLSIPAFFRRLGLPALTCRICLLLLATWFPYPRVTVNWSAAVRLRSVIGVKFGFCSFLSLCGFSYVMALSR